MTLTIPQKTLDRLFRVGVALKGVDGLFEVLGGSILLFLPVAKIQDTLVKLALYEIQEGNKHAFIASFILHLDQKIDTHTQLFAAIYLMCHGVIKLFLVLALLRRHYHLYPYAIGFLLLFIAYQAYLVGYNHSVLLLVLTMIDCAIAWLTYLEWKRHRRPTIAQ